MECNLWRMDVELPVVEVSFRLSLERERGIVQAVLTVLKGKQLDGWTAEQIKKAAETYSIVGPIRTTAPEMPIIQ